MQFLEKLGGRWNISLFHYRNHGADFGRVLAGFEVPPSDMRRVRGVPRRRSATNISERARTTLTDCSSRRGSHEVHGSWFMGSWFMGSWVHEVRIPVSQPNSTRNAKSLHGNALSVLISSASFGPVRHPPRVSSSNASVLNALAQVGTVRIPGSCWPTVRRQFAPVPGTILTTHRGRGVARAILQRLLDVGRAIGCAEAWVLTERTNEAALRLYKSSGGIEAPSDQVMLTFRLQDSGVKPSR